MRLSDDLVGESAPNFNVRLVLIALVAVPLSLATTLMPHEMPIKWVYVWVAVAISFVIALSALASDQAARRGHRVPNWLGIVDLTAMIVAAGFAVYAASGQRGIYNPLLLIVLAMFAMWGDRPLLVYGCVVTLAVLTVATLASGVPPGETATIVTEYGICFVITATIVFLLMEHARRERENSAALASTARSISGLAQAAAGFTELEPALATCLPLLADTFGGVLVRAVQLDAAGRPAIEPVVVAASGDPDDIRDLEAIAAAVRVPSDAGLEAHRIGTTLCIRIGEVDGAVIVLVFAGFDDAVIGGAAIGDPVVDVEATAMVSSMAAVMANVIERASLVAALERMTITDPLTMVPNRLALTRRLAQEMAMADRTRLPLSIVMIDLDHFKDYNDTYGHVAGDAALRAVASVLQTRIRRTDLVARYGGEEFCVCLPNTGLDGAARVINDARTRVHELVADAPLSFSAGIASWNFEESADELLARADTALYQAKDAGRDRVCLDRRSARTPSSPDLS